jgi:hypothetical protein
MKSGLGWEAWAFGRYLKQSLLLRRTAVERIPFPVSGEQDRHLMLTNDRIPGEMISLHFYTPVT